MADVSYVTEDSPCRKWRRWISTSSRFSAWARPEEFEQYQPMPTSDQRALFDVKPNVAPERGDPAYPDWFYPGNWTPVSHKSNVLRGRHPFGSELGPASATCGECVSAYANKQSKVYWKCKKLRPTSGLGTDIRKRWRACDLFVPT